MNLLVSRKKLLGNTGDFLWSYGGYLIVSVLCDLCGVVLNVENARYFVSECIESLNDTLKSNLNINGVNYVLSLNDDLISKFIEFYKGKEGTLIDSKFEITSPNLDLPFKFPKTQAVWADLCSFKVNQDCQIKPLAFCKGTDSISSLSLYGNYSSFSKGDIVSYKFAWDISGNYYYLLNLYKNGSYVAQAYQGYGSANPGPKYLDLEFLLRADISLIDKDTFKSFVGATYPSTFGDVSTLGEYKAKYENEPSKIILDSSVVNVKTKWKKQDTEIYIADCNIENLPNGVSLAYCQYLFKEGDQCTSVTGGWNFGGSFSIVGNYMYGKNTSYTEVAQTVNNIDFSKYSKLYFDGEFNFAEITNITQITTDRRETVEVDIANINSSMKLRIDVTGGSRYAKIYNIWLE